MGELRGSLIIEGLSWPWDNLGDLSCLPERISSSNMDLSDLLDFSGDETEDRE